jgi:hypothetical protein
MEAICSSETSVLTTANGAISQKTFIVLTAVKTSQTTAFFVPTYFISYLKCLIESCLIKRDLQTNNIRGQTFNHSVVMSFLLGKLSQQNIPHFNKAYMLYTDIFKSTPTYTNIHSPSPPSLASCSVFFWGGRGSHSASIFSISGFVSPCLCMGLRPWFVV